MLKHNVMNVVKSCQTPVYFFSIIYDIFVSADADL